MVMFTGIPETADMANTYYEQFQEDFDSGDSENEMLSNLESCLSASDTCNHCLYTHLVRCQTPSCYTRHISHRTYSSPYSDKDNYQIDACAYYLIGLTLVGKFMWLLWWRAEGTKR